MKILISAAETSSDHHGAELLKALKKRNPQIEAFGIGGPSLQKEGLEATVDARELSIMGITEVLYSLPKILKCLKRISVAAGTKKPDLAILIDYPDFHFRLAKRLKELGVPVLYYIPPKVWVWRKWRLKAIRKYFSGVLSILPFEEPVYRREGIPFSYVGNPLIDQLPQNLTRDSARKDLGLSPREMVFTLLPGSRPGELKNHFSLMLASTQRAALKLGKPARVLVALPDSVDEKKWEALASSFDSIQVSLLKGKTYEAMAAADAALVKSGTSTLEAALVECPHVVVYKPNWVTGWMFQNLVTYKGPVGLSNLVLNNAPDRPAEENVFTEVLCGDVTEANLERELLRLLTDSEKQRKVKEAFVKVRENIFRGIEQSPSEKAAEEVLRMKRLISAFPEARTRSFFKSGFNVLVSGVWSVLSSLARVFLSIGVLRSTALKSRVVSVGNIQVGGAGKTPLVAKIAQEAKERGLVCCILTRGYRGEWELSGGVIAPGDVGLDPKKTGDEISLLHEQAPHAWIGVGADRVGQYQKVCERLGGNPDLVILDDGFQHWKIKKDLEIVALTSKTRGQTLFREWRSALEKADLLVWTKGDSPPNPEGKPLVKIRYRIKKGEGVPVWLVTGVADGLSVRHSLVDAGYEVKKHLEFPDHAVYARSSVEGILKEAKEANCRVAVTGKDWVKWKQFGIEEDVIVLEPELDFLEGRDLWSQKLWGSSPSVS